MDLKTIKEITMDYIDAPKDKSIELSGLPTGFYELDRKLLGMQAGQLITIGSRPGIGKTSISINIMLNSIEDMGLSVLYFSTGETCSDIVEKICSPLLKLPMNELKSKCFSTEKIKSLNKIISKIIKYPIFIHDKELSISDIERLSLELKENNNIGLIVVDYIQMVNQDESLIFSTRDEQLSDISKRLKYLAKKIGCVVIAISQLNRQSELRIDKRPYLSDLANTGALEQDSDIIMLLYRDEFYFPYTTKEKNIAEVIIAKNRRGEVGTVKVAFKKEYASFENLIIDSDNEDEIFLN